jgi:hypothetical protein
MDVGTRRTHPARTSAGARLGDRRSDCRLHQPQQRLRRNGSQHRPFVRAPQHRSALRNIGYRPRVIEGDTEFFRRLSNPRGDWSISEGDWINDYPSPGEFLAYFLSCANYHPEDPSRTTNAGGFCTPQFDRLVNRAENLQPLKVTPTMAIFVVSLSPRPSRRVGKQGSHSPRAPRAGAFVGQSEGSANSRMDEEK